MSKRSIYEESKSNLLSLIKQTAQIGLGFVGILLLTGRNPSPLILGGSVLGGIVFVAYSEGKRLNHE